MLPPSLQTAAQLLHSLEQRRQRALLETRVAPFDRLQGGGLARGTMVELAGARSSGRFALLLASLAAATRGGEAAGLVDLGDQLDPRGAEAAGVDLRRLLWVRPRSVKEALMAAEMVVSAGFALVGLNLGSAPIALHRVPPSVWVRLARAAETHNCALLCLSPTPLRTPMAASVVTATGARGAWVGQGDEPKLLAGISSRLVVARRAGAETQGGFSLGVREQIEWREGA